jgi:hypothetical protein
MEDKDNKKDDIIETDNLSWQVPQCCREGWDSCPHAIDNQLKKVKKEKTNVGL